MNKRQANVIANSSVIAVNRYRAQNLYSSSTHIRTAKTKWFLPVLGGVFLCFFVAKADDLLSVRFDAPNPWIMLIAAGCLFTAFSSRTVRLPYLFQQLSTVGAPLGIMLLLSGWGAFCSVMFGVAKGTEEHYLVLPLFDGICFVFGLFIGIALSVNGHNSYTVWRSVSFLWLCAYSISIAIDLINPGTFSTVPSRSAGFAMNSNDGAFCICFLCILSLDWRNGIIDLMSFCSICLSLGCVFATYSRSGLCVLACVCVLFLSVVCRKGWGTILIGLITASLMAITAPIVIGMVVENTSQGSGSARATAILNGDFDVVFNKDDYRAHLAKYFLDLAWKEPVLGWGTRFSYSLIHDQGPHNIYIAQFLDNGLPALILLATLFATILLRAIHRRDMMAICMICTVILYGFFSHNVLDLRGVLLLLGFISCKSHGMYLAKDIRAYRDPLVVSRRRTAA